MIGQLIGQVGIIVELISRELRLWLTLIKELTSLLLLLLMLLLLELLLMLLLLVLLLLVVPKVLLMR